MSNEELVAEIQAGHEERMGELWEQVAGLVKWKALRIINGLVNLHSIEFDDLYQSGYLALAEAVKTYQPGTGAFSTWFMYHLKTAFAEATGYRTDREKRDPLNYAVSMDAPITGEDGSETAFGDLIENHNASARIDNVEEKLFCKELRRVLDTLLDTIPGPCRKVLQLRYYDDLGRMEISNLQCLGYQEVRKLEDKGIRTLRKPSAAKYLKPFLDFDFYCGTGLGAFRNSGMSIQERYVIKQEDKAERYSVVKPVMEC